MPCWAQVATNDPTYDKQLESWNYWKPIAPTFLPGESQHSTPPHSPARHSRHAQPVQLGAKSPPIGSSSHGLSRWARRRGMKRFLPLHAAHAARLCKRPSPASH